MSSCITDCSARDWGYGPGFLSQFATDFLTTGPAMKSKLLLVLVAGLAAACTQQPPSASRQAAVPPQPTGAQTCTQAGFYSPLPVDVQLAFPFQLRGDRIFTNKKGKVRRRVTIELLEGSAGDAFASASQSLVAAGYKAKGQPKGEPTTRQSQAFTMKGKPSIALVSNADVGTKPANPDAVGLVSFEWTVPGKKK